MPPCEDTPGVRFICGPRNVEDLIAVPGGSWVIASGLGLWGTDYVGPEDAAHPRGALYLLDVRDKSWQVLYPKTQPLQRHDKKTYPACSTAPDSARFTAHGINLRPGEHGIHTLYSVNHGAREAIEVFELDTTQNPPSITWIGCVKFPEGSMGNAVAPLPHPTTMRDPRA